MGPFLSGGNTYFNKTLRSRYELLRYHELLEAFSEDNIMKWNTGIRTTTAKTMKHLLIDEFQDISPELVKWIKGVTKYLNSIGEECSLMCVGDDWQSIYGWRGSSPYYIVKYRTEFKTDPVGRIIELVENRRCYQDLLDKATIILEKVAPDQRTPKRVTCIKGINPMEEKTLETIFGESDEDILPTIKEILQKVRKGEKIYVLCRNNIKRMHFANLLKSLPVKVLTYHGSKGLEGHYCVLIGDCAYITSSPFKNMIYNENGNTAKYNQTYDETQKDEARRLVWAAE